VCAQVTQTKTGLSAVRTFSPLGVKPCSCILNPSNTIVVIPLDLLL
jgi:hypothetical protein